MKAIKSIKYGAPDVFEYVETLQPTPKPNEVLIRVHATTVTAADIMMRKGNPVIGRLYLGIIKPKKMILGFDFAGDVIEAGNDVTLFKAGDKVFGGTTALGCYAEYVCVNSEDVITAIPGNISYEEAAPVSGSAITALNFLKGKGKIKENQKVLINGASGALGTYAIQIAKYFGAEVTGVCSSANLEMVKALGADYVIDYTTEDFTKKDIQYDLIFDTVGNRSFTQCKKALAKNGSYLSAVFGFRIFLHSIMSSLCGGKKVKLSATGLLPVKQRLEYLKELKVLLDSGEIKTVIDHFYTLSQMKEAHKYVEKGRKKGNVIITI